MGKRPEDEIQKKLVELELSIKDEESKRRLPSASHGSGTQLSAPANADIEKVQDALSSDLLKIGGIGCIIFGVVMFFSHIVITNVGQPFFWGVGIPATGAMGFLVIPLLIGISMLFYNYKSRRAQIVTVGSLIAIALTVITQMRLNFQPMVLTDFIVMALPIAAGCAMMAKAHSNRRYESRLEDKNKGN